MGLYLRSFDAAVVSLDLLIRRPTVSTRWCGCVSRRRWSAPCAIHCGRSTQPTRCSSTWSRAWPSHHPTSTVVHACRRTCSETVARGDFNHAAARRTETSRTERTDLTQLVRQPTRGNNVLSTASYELSSLLLSLITRPCCCVLSKSQYRVSSLLPK